MLLCKPDTGVGKAALLQACSMHTVAALITRCGFKALTDSLTDNAKWQQAIKLVSSNIETGASVFWCYSHNPTLVSASQSYTCTSVGTAF